MTKQYPIDALTPSQLQACVAAWQRGEVLALATDTVYGLAAAAFNEPAISRIYQLKERPSGMPLQLLAADTQTVKQYTQWNEDAEKLAAACWPGALTLILLPNEKGQSLRRGFTGLGWRVPAHEGLRQVLQALPFPLACTSANRHGEPVLTQEETLLSFIDGQVPYALTAGTLSATASSVVDLTAQPRLLREGVLSRSFLEKVLAKPLK